MKLIIVRNGEPPAKAARAGSEPTGLQRDRALSGEGQADKRPHVGSVVVGIQILEDGPFDEEALRGAMPEAGGDLERHAPEVAPGAEVEWPARSQDLHDESGAGRGGERIGAELAARREERH